MSSLKTLISKVKNKISIAIIGLKNAGKTELVKRILQTEDFLQISTQESLGLKLYVHENLTLLTWDIIDSLPSDHSLWKRAILGANVLFFIVDSTDRAHLTLNKQLLWALIEEVLPDRLLILGSKADSSKSISIDELLDTLEVVELDKRTRCHCDLFKFSAKTGEGMYTIEEWLTKTLFKQRERIIDYVHIAACVTLCEETSDLMDVILTPKPDLSLITTIHHIRRKATIFSRVMRIHKTAEEVTEHNKYKIVLVKQKGYVIALIVNQNDSVPRAIQIAKNILQLVKDYCTTPESLKKTITLLYPLDVAN
ncbi:MAG: ADP-ribosylation factor-like protein [Candidatus Heimdallarchaeota archaeon]|nr:MAG: hypothetical protein DRP02_02005 [Candidatus Gerdarchaeota archaeon]RLI73062.1 MAG: hypothetical protein DRO91_03735 [Candidatus Heimdallarchaeota archaeon]